MWSNRRTRFPENVWEFGIMQKIFKTKLQHVSYLINSATLIDLLLFCFGLTIKYTLRKFLHTFSWFPDRAKYFCPVGMQ